MNHCRHCDAELPAEREYCGRSCRLLDRQEDRKFARPVSRDTGPPGHRLDQYYGQPFRLPHWVRIAACVFLLAICGCSKRTVCSPPVQKVPTTQQESQTFVRQWNEYARALGEGHVISLEMWERVVKAWDRMTSE
jgi:hypothetical protein